MYQGNSAAAALDAADGVMDGRFFGRNIVQAGQPQFTTAPAFSGVSTFGGMGSNAAALDAADGVIDGKFYGRPIVQQTTPQFATPSFGGGIIQSAPMVMSQPTFGAVSTFGGANSSALALDAADGRIDGRYFGRPIVQQAAPQVISQPAFGGYTGLSTGFASPVISQPAFTSGVSSAALSLDAADGVIDGRHFGRPIVQQSAPQFIQSTPQFIQQPQIISTTPAVSQSALALDAADGRIDGKFFGRQIVQGGPQVIQTQPQFIQAQPQIIQQPMMVQQPVANSALALDAADGRIDGKFFGRPIVQQGGPQVIRSTTPAGAGGAAQALDAADGVMDGRFFGRPIVQGGRQVRGGRV